MKLTSALQTTALVILTTLVINQPASAVFLGFPSLDPNDGKFINVTRGFSSLGDVGVDQRTFNVSLAIPKVQAVFPLWIFDGNVAALWDRIACGGDPVDETHFELYPDPNLQGNDSVGLLYTWHASAMPEDNWCELDTGGSCTPGASLPQDLSPGGACDNLSGNCYYHLVAKWASDNCVKAGDDPNAQGEQNSFKVGVEGQPFLLAGSSIGFTGFGCNENVLPGCTVASIPYLTATNYDGEFRFYFLVPDPGPGQQLQQLRLYDGDFDLWPDTDDPNSSDCSPPGVPPGNPGGCGFPPFQTSPLTVPEGLHPGVPRDDQSLPIFRISPNIYYDVTAPGGAWTVTNLNPSGDKEWELFAIGPGATPVPNDVQMATLPTGLYTWTIKGVDYLNTLFVHTLYELYMSGPACELVLTKTCQTSLTPAPSTTCQAVSGESVTYRYRVTNSSITTATNIGIIDNLLGAIAGPFTLGPGGTATFTNHNQILRPATNVATVTGLVGASLCMASASATVNLQHERTSTPAITPFALTILGGLLALIGAAAARWRRYG